jgi:hypothetical protein
MTPEQLARLEKVEQFIAGLSALDRYTFQKHIQILDARNIQVGKDTGTKIGTESAQKLGFYGTTPVVQAGAITAPSGGGTAGVDNPARTTIVAILTALKNMGITQ